MGERKITSNLKMKEKTKKARNWTKQETEPFERTLADREEDFINFLEKKALKKDSARSWQFHIRKLTKKFASKEGRVQPYESFDLYVLVLQFKYKKLKRN